MKKDPDAEKGRNVTAVRHDEKSALRLNAILAEIPFIILARLAGWPARPLRT
jgi:hypothetical protein